MAKYKLSEEAKKDLIRIHHYGVGQFGQLQADKYFNTFFDYFDLIAENPHSFESVDHIRMGYKRCVCGSDSIFYRVKNEEVEIMAIIGKQDLNQLF
jgi:toxin ParE1/3/4